jgi:RNA polymerase sigma-70 factor (ECF subfamily)
MDRLTDEELLVLFKRGRQDAFSLIYERHARGLFLFLLRMCGTRTLAEEMLQDVLFKVARAAPSYEARGRFRPWLYRIASNHAVNVLGSARERAEGRVVPLSVVEGTATLAQIEAQQGVGAGAALSAPHAEPALRAEARETRDEILAAVAALDPRYRTVFLLREVLHMSLEEIAQAVELPLGTIKTHLHRARERLRRSLLVQAAATGGSGAPAERGAGR